MRRILLLIPGLMLLLFAACKHDDLEIVKENENFRLAADFIKNNYDMTLFSAAIEKAGMTAELQGAGPFTALVPVNTAFQEIGINRPSDFDKMHPDSLKALVQRHLLPQRLLTGEIPANGVDIRYRTLGGTEVYASQANSSKYGNFPASNVLLYLNGSFVTRKDVNVANGVIQVLNQVMKYTRGNTVQDWLAKHSEYSIFVSGLKKFGYWDRLATPGPYTVFAPQNKEFETKGITEATIAALNTTTYSGARLFGAYIFEKSHFFISDFDVFSKTSAEGSYDRKLADDSWYITTSVSSATLTAPLSYGMYLRTGLIYPYEQFPGAGGSIPALNDNLCDNGLVHDLQGLLLLPEQAVKK